jgi:hypothetical protein
VECTSITPFGVAGYNLAVKEKQNVNFQIGEIPFKHNFLVSQLPVMAAGILGVNFLTPRRTVLDLVGSTTPLCRRVNYAAVEIFHVSSSEVDC